MAIVVENWTELAEKYAEKHPSEILALAAEKFSPNIGISFSGAEDVVLVDLAAKLGAKFRVFSLDTARLHIETYQYLEKVRDKYKIDIEIYFPKPEPVQKLVETRSSSPSIRMAIRNVAESAKLSRCAAPLPPCPPGSLDSAAIRALPPAPSFPWCKPIPPSPLLRTP